jgi:hypothetical protein
MWRTEKFGAVSSQGQQATRRASIFLNPEGIRYTVDPAWIHPEHRRREHWRRAMHSVFEEPLILRDFGAGPRPFCLRLLTKYGKLNRQTPIYRNHSKSQKTNDRDLLKSPKNQILQHHNLRACVLIWTLKNQQFPPFQTGSALQTEIAVTHSKQSLGSFLPGSRIAPLSSTDRALAAASTLTFLSDRRPIRYNAPGPNFSREARNLT